MNFLKQVETPFKQPWETVYSVNDNWNLVMNVCGLGGATLVYKENRNIQITLSGNDVNQIAELIKGIK